MKIDWLSKLQHLLETVGFSLGVATILWVMLPSSAYGPNAVYSLCIGIITWTIIDVGRHAFASAAETGWPQGMAGNFLIFVGMVGGFIGGSIATNFIGSTFNWFNGPDLMRFEEMRIAVIVTLIAGGGGTFFFYSRSKSAYLERKIVETRKHADEARLKLLETQLEPHMLFNTLANLRALIGVDPTRAQVMLDHMIAYLRATLSGSRSASHSLQEEFDRLRDYLELMTIRMGPRLSYSLELPKDLEQTRVPALLLQPLVENSIQHGLEPKVQGGRIRVTASHANGNVVLEVSDTGVGPSGKATAHGKGFGMNQVRERLATVFADRAHLDFAAVPEGGCRTIIRYPLAP